MKNIRVQMRQSRLTYRSVRISSSNTVYITSARGIVCAPTRKRTEKVKTVRLTGTC